MSSQPDYLEFFVQAGKMLGSTGNRLAKINMVLVMLTDYFGIRNPVLLIRDSVINSYNIELAPELTQEELGKASEQFGAFVSRHKRRFAYEQMLFGREAAEMPLTTPVDIADRRMAFFSCPIVGQDKSLQTGILTALIANDGSVTHKAKLLKVLAGQLGFYLDSTGSIPRRVYKSGIEEPPVAMEGIIGESRAIKQVCDTIRSVATSRASVFIRGESGTGKELIARNIHDHSLRSRAPFISLNCAAVSENLLLNELFGHEKGAFTGATASAKGRFEAANGGTLFLDEIGETSLNFQAKLLRVLQEGEFERLGSSETIKVDVRIVCATNADIESLVRQRLFREDLYYRLNVLPIWSPSLAERREDIPHLVRHFLMKLNNEYGKMVITTQDQVSLLQQLDWPGNVRELENFIHRSFLVEREGRIDVAAALSVSERSTAAGIPGSGLSAHKLSDRSGKVPNIESEEKKAIELALDKSGGVQVKAAKRLGITLRQLRYRIAKYGIVVRKIR